jgi:hypothetical protein
VGVSLCLSKNAIPVLLSLPASHALSLSFYTIARVFLNQEVVPSWFALTQSHTPPTTTNKMYEKLATALNNLVDHDTATASTTTALLEQII